MKSFLLLLCLAATAGAQSIKGAVPTSREPHHHLAYEDATLRVLRVRVAPHDTTLLHEHALDYFWIAVGASTIVNAKLGAPEATIASKDLSIHYTPGKFAHVARNTGATPFDNITIEVLEPQGAVRNLCEAALADGPLTCAAPVTTIGPGVTEHPAFATTRMRVSLVTIAPGAALKMAAEARPVWAIAVDTADAGRRLVSDGTGKWVGGTLRSTAAQTITNRGTAPIKLLVVRNP